MESDKTNNAGTSTAEKQKTSPKKSNAATSGKINLQTGMTGKGVSKRDYSQEATKEGALYKFFLDGLKDMYFAEKHILEALPKMQNAATTEELQDAFEDHHLVTQKHVSRLEKVFKSIGETAEAKKCDAIIGIVKEGENIIKETDEGTMTRDAALIIAAQKVEHYEIASYGGLVALAETLNLEQAADLLQMTLEEEEETDLDLTDIAESSINFRAADEEDEEDDDDDSE